MTSVQPPDHPAGAAARCRRRVGGRDRGGATVCLLAVGLIFVLSGTFGAGVGAARVARQQARVAADFGALAGAGRALHDESQACARAAELVAANGARLVRCQVDGIDVVVTAAVSVRPLPGISRVATATSRAGPVRG
ncbi:Rv3654c family TadE-like protein [Micromonospora sp. NPDC049900]|uniref:Rv3654c family TadE-like protein n=1 Tax=Micromonospora sp. NPDC049900 TaxID=3364275 RepID=UPI0037A88899